MTWARARNPSLLRSIGKSPVEWWLIYTETDLPHWWARLLKPGFRHVCAMRRDGRVWVLFWPTLGLLDIEILRTDAQPWEIFPTARVQRVVALRAFEEWRAPWVFSPVTCVELVKGLLGIRRFWLWTPHQLFRYCNTGVLDHG